VSFLLDETSLFTIGLEGFAPELRLAKRPDDPLAYQLFPIFLLLAWIFIIYCASMVAYQPFTRLGEQEILARLAKIHPEDRQEELKRLCKLLGVQMRFEEDFKSEYKDEDKSDGIKEVPIDVL
jgi:hypothetical protein